MKLTIELTDIITHLDGIEVRLWEGRTESGRLVKVFVRRVISDDPIAQDELAAALQKMDEPHEARVIPLWMIL